MEQNRNTIAAINHQHAIRIKFRDHFFVSGWKKLTVVEVILAVEDALLWSLPLQRGGGCRQG